MTEVEFFEKPGCINNTKQKRLLMNAGHHVIERNLLKHEWVAEELKEYFGSLPIVKWFNTSAPAIKQGKVDPFQLDEHQALALMVADPLLIRRPLMRVGDRYMVGFDVEKVDHWIGLDYQDSGKDSGDDLESCPRQN